MINQAKSQRLKVKGSRGFTLVELLVSVGLFVVVFTIATGSVVAVVNANRKSQSLKSVMNNLNIALESMTIDLRFGTRYSCGNTGTPADCDAGGTGVGFLDRNGARRAYRLQSGRLQRCIDGSGGCVFTDVTAPEVNITSLTFFVTGADPSGDNEQPKILLVIRGTAGTGKTATTFNLQTSISQREIDLVLPTT